MEEKLTAAFAQKGFKLVRAHAYSETEKHGFISSQRMGMDVFMNIHPEAKLVFATAAWQYSHHVLPGLRSHKGPILTVANWSGQWPGLVGLLNLNGSLVKAGKQVFVDLEQGLHGRISSSMRWTSGCATARSATTCRMCTRSTRSKLPAESAALGAQLAADLKHRKAIMGIFDEGCMGMYNAIIDDELLNPAGILQGAAEPVGAGGEDADGDRR